MIKSFLLICTILCSAYAQWQSDLRLSNNPAESWTSYNNTWYVASHEYDVHVTWYDGRDGNWEIYYKRSTDGGVSWGTDTRLTNTTSPSERPSIAVSGQDLHIVWVENGQIYYKYSTTSGITWQSSTQLTNTTAYLDEISLAASGQLIGIVWSDYRNVNTEIYYKCSINGGTNWSTDTRLTTNTTPSMSPSLAVFGLVVHVVWFDFCDGNGEIYYKRSTDAGESWESNKRLTNNTAHSECPSVAVSGSTVHVVWRETRDGNDEIYYKRSTNGGLSWETDTRLTHNPATSFVPSISVSGSIVHIVWEEYRDENIEIYYKRSTDGGINWEADIRLTNNPSCSYTPSISVSGSIVHVVWYDNRDGNDEIYYKRNPTGNSIGIKKISNKVPEEFMLYQNYPNPFNPATLIKFEIPNLKSLKAGETNSKTEIRIYDILGREVATLVNEQLSPGTYEVEFDGTNFPSGVYYYTLSDGDFIETKKMVLIK